VSPERPVYLDYNATTPVDPRVFEAMRPYLREEFGNPSSSHPYGVRARQAVERARAQVAGLLGCSPGEVLFTSCGTESNNLAIRGACMARRGRGRHIVTTAVEHPATTEVCRGLEREGFTVTIVDVDGTGLADPAAVEAALTGETVLVTVMHANNEVGTIQPVAEIAAAARARGIAVHTDAAQSPGKIPVDARRLGVDLLSVAGHKLYAPKGVGALYVREGTRLECFMRGAGQERGLRPGTESVPLIVGLGEACEIARRDLERNAAHMKAMRDRLHGGLDGALEGIRLNGHPEKRLPNTLSLGFPGLEAPLLLEAMKGVAASAGSACHAGAVDVSPVLLAMKVPPDCAAGTVRFSTGRSTTADEIDRAVEEIVTAVRGLRDF
jgi:cysteine desulfurase